LLQLPLGLDQTDFDFDGENPEYLSEQLITYIGNKRSLLSFIGRGIVIAANRIGKQKLRVADMFSGSGIVSRYLKRFASELITNDIEKYAQVISQCYLANKSLIDMKLLRNAYDALNERLGREPLQEGIITKHYSPDKDSSIKKGERAFYTRRNAMFLDTSRSYIEKLPANIQHFVLAPLLSEASVHANTSGVFKGFYKDRHTGIGQYGGTNQDALFRIKGEIAIPFPLFSNYECEVSIYRDDANSLSNCLEEVDIAYLDPPYNQHPYGSNYFMLNLLLDYRKPEQISKVSGIPTDWIRSAYNKRQHAFNAFSNLVKRLKAKFLLISFNSEGFIKKEEMVALLKQIGSLEVLETRYNTFRGSRNLRNRDIHVKEYLYLVEKR
jgi:adenine-specific DNA-methyltransferase